MNLKISTLGITFLGCIFILMITTSVWYYSSKHVNTHHEQTPQHAPQAMRFNRLSSSDLDKLQQLFKQGDEEYDGGNVKNAITYYRQALSRYPLIVEALIRLGKAYAKQDKHELAISEYKAALSINPTDVEGYLLLSRSLRAQKKLSDALFIVRHALTLRPTLFSAHIELAKIFADQHDYDQALSAIEKAHQINPNNVYAHLMKGHILNWKGDIEGAIAMYKKATQLDPTLSNAHYNLGHTLKVYGKFNEAIESLNKAAALNPHHVDTHVALSHVYWALGDFDQAWQEYEWRWKQHKKDPRNKTIPEWQGEDIKGKTILLYSEQGFGDTLQFIRFAQYMKQQGATVWCKVQKQLVTLLSLCPYIDHIINDNSNIRALDYQVALMDMPGKLKLTPQTVPAPDQYLYADKQLSNVWRDKLSSDKNFKIGVCWHVDERHEIYKLPIQRRAFPVQALLPLAQDKHISLYSLQLVDNAIRAEIPSEMNVHIFDHDFDKTRGSFMDSAAVITNLDLIITADTAIAHLAAGLGKKVWMLLPYSPDCRWYLQTESSPWYPSMSIFRQSEAGNWKPVTDKITTSLNNVPKLKAMRNQQS